jgi:hypothetical protein
VSENQKEAVHAEVLLSKEAEGTVGRVINIKYFQLRQLSWKSLASFLFFCLDDHMT